MTRPWYKLVIQPLGTKSETGFSKEPVSRPPGAVRSESSSQPFLKGSGGMAIPSQGEPPGAALSRTWPPQAQRTHFQKHALRLLEKQSPPCVTGVCSALKQQLGITLPRKSSCSFRLSSQGSPRSPGHCMDLTAL